MSENPPATREAVNADSAQDVKNMLNELKTERPVENTVSEKKIDPDSSKADEVKTETQVGAGDIATAKTSSTPSDPVNSNPDKVASSEISEKEKAVTEKSESIETKVEEKSEAISVPESNEKETKANGSTHDSRDGANGHFDRGGRGRGGSRGARGSRPFKTYRNNIKSVFTEEEETDDPVQIRKQVEFYFSDSNLPRDKFLLSHCEGPKNIPVEISILHSFKRMRRFQPLSAIVAALKDSSTLDLTDNNSKVKRKVPYQPVKPSTNESDVQVWEDRSAPRSIYAKGFGDETARSQLDIEAFFAKFGAYNAVRLRRNDQKNFKGSVFVEWESETQQKAFLALDPRPQYNGKELQIMSKQTYCDKKVQDINAGKIKASSKNTTTNPRNTRSSNARGGAGGQKRGWVDPRDWRTRRDQDKKNEKRRENSDSREPAGEKDEASTTTTTAPEKDSARIAREAATAAALAQAKLMVEAQRKQAETTTETKAEDQGKAESKTEGVKGAEGSEAAGKKRARETEDGGHGEGERETKRRSPGEKAGEGESMAA